MDSRTIFIWDIHGCYKELQLLLKKINLTETDKVYFTWDLIDRWPKSFKVLKYIYENKDRFFVVAWNNDLDFIDWYEWKADFSYCTKRYEELKNKIEKKEALYLIDYLKSLPLFIEDERFILVHAGIKSDKKLEEHSADELTRIRVLDWKPWYYYYNEEKPIIYWHWAKEWLTIRKNTIWLDSWCVYDKWLTAYILETWEIYSQTSTSRYIDLYSQ